MKSILTAGLAAAAFFFVGVLDAQAQTAPDAASRDAAKRLAISMCASCHGAEGAGSKPMIPRLAGQQKAYIVAQLKSFRRHNRDDPEGHDFMWGVAAMLDDNIVDGLGEYFSTRPPMKGTPGDPALTAAGEKLVPAAEEAAVRHQLNEHQQKAVDMVATRVRAREHRTFLLHGVTGSGKTEVYLRILEAVRAAGRSAIVLVPEISLTPQTVGRFASRFPDTAVLHSGLTDAERGRQWQRLLQGKARIAIGARSALFAPVQDLGLIVVDEEHESSFKQDSTPRYHAREMAIVRGELEKAVVVLGSATPTLESIGKARRGIYELLTLPQRAGAGRMPRIVVQDLRSEPK